MIRSGLAFGLGVAVGVVIVGAAVYYIYTQKNSEMDKEKASAEKFSEKLKTPKEHVKKLTELLASQSYVDLLTAKELTTWFKENRSQFSKDVKMIVSTPTEKHIQGLGYDIDTEIDSDKNVLQMFYDPEKKTALKIRLVNFAEIESNLQAHLIEEDGMLIIED